MAHLATTRWIGNNSLRSSTRRWGTTSSPRDPMGYWRWTNTGVLDGWADRKSVRECDVLYDAMWGAQTNAEDDVPGEPVSLGWLGNHRVISTPVADVLLHDH